MADTLPFYPQLKFWQEFYTTNLCSFDGYNQRYLMDVNTSLTPSEQLSQAVVRGMQEKKASDIVLMDLRNVKNAVADFFVGHIVIVLVLTEFVFSLVQLDYLLVHF